MNAPRRRTRGRAAPLLIAALVVAGGGVAVLSLGSLQQVRRLRQQLTARQQQLTQLEAQNQEFAQQVSELQRERKEFEERLSALRTQLASSSTELERSRVSLQEFKDQYEEIAEERTRLQAQLASVTNERDQTKQQLQRLEEQYAHLERSASRFRERLALLDRDYRLALAKLAEVQPGASAAVDAVSMVSSIPPPSTGSAAADAPPSTVAGAIELPPIVVHKEREVTATPIVGRLIQVNEPHRFIVVDKGRQDGVQVGMVFSILRGNTLIGRATAVRVHPRLSACNLISSHSPQVFQIGDLVVQAAGS